MALYIPRSIFHLARLLYVRPETFGPTLVPYVFRNFRFFQLTRIVLPVWQQLLITPGVQRVSTSFIIVKISN
jgi:hypothetical protein